MRFIIDFVNSALPADIEAYMAANGCTVVQEFSNFEKTYVVECDAEPAAGELVESIVIDDEAGMSLQDVPMRSFATSDDDHWWKLAVLGGIDLEQEQVSYNVGGDDVRVYVLDSGIMAEHVEFAGKDITLLHSVVEGDFTDATGHGTAIASVIVGEQCGITNASLRVVKIFHEGHTTLISDLLAAFNAVLNDYVTRADYLAIMNLSWSISKNAYVESKIQALIDIGLFAVVSAGNSGQPISNVTPASMAEAITVGSFGQDLAPSDFTDYTGITDTSLTEGQTNHGGLDLFAPGEGIRIAKLTGEYGYTAGTSIAAAITSAIAVLNIRSSGYTWAFTQHENEADQLVRAVCTSDILTLEGIYTGSPNLVPVANRTRLTHRTAPGRFILPTGTDFALHAYSVDFYKSAVLSGGPEWLVLSNNFLTGVAPATDHVLTASATLTLVNLLDETEILDIYFVVHAPEMTREEVGTEIRADIEFNIFYGNCDDYCSYSCCTCCGEKFGSYCQDCYRAFWGCLDTFCQ
jgi:subtilisin family serine protease